MDTFWPDTQDFTHYKRYMEGDTSGSLSVSSGGINSPQRLDRLIHKKGLADTPLLSTYTEN
jgi:hypothetical protein